MRCGRFLLELIMKSKFLIIFLQLFPLLLISQDLTRYFEYLKCDQADSVKKAMPQLIQNYPNNVDVLFLSALVETDGDKALLIYRDVVSQYPDSDRADDALVKIIEYLYTKGLYKKTISYSKQLITKYPQSENIAQGVYMLLSSFSVMNKKDSVDYYYDYYLKRYPDLDLKFYNYQSAPAYVTVEQVATKTPAAKQPVAPPMTVSRGKFTLQVGAFGNPQNAFVLKNRLKTLGYDPYVQKIKGNNQDLLSVRVGRFNSRNDAVTAKKRLKTMHKIDSIVVQRDSWE